MTQCLGSSSIASKGSLERTMSTQPKQKLMDCVSMRIDVGWVTRYRGPQHRAAWASFSSAWASTGPPKPERWKSSKHQVLSSGRLLSSRNRTSRQMQQQTGRLETYTSRLRPNRFLGVLTAKNVICMATRSVGNFPQAIKLGSIVIEKCQKRYLSCRGRSLLGSISPASLYSWSDDETGQVTNWGKLIRSQHQICPICHLASFTTKPGVSMLVYETLSEGSMRTLEPAKRRNVSLVQGSGIGLPNLKQTMPICYNTREKENRYIHGQNTCYSLRQIFQYFFIFLLVGAGAHTRRRLLLHAAHNIGLLVWAYMEGALIGWDLKL